MELLLVRPWLYLEWEAVWVERNILGMHFQSFLCHWVGL